MEEFHPIKFLDGNILDLKEIKVTENQKKKKKKSCISYLGTFPCKKSFSEAKEKKERVGIQHIILWT